MARAAILALLLALAVPAAAPAAFLDAVLATSEETAVTASEIGLARALRLFDLTPVQAPIEEAEVRRYLDARLLEREAVRLEIQPKADEVEAAWRTLAARLGGEAALEAWLERADVSPGWARQMVEADLRRRAFIDLRFRAFAFITPMDVDAALGPGPHSASEREAAERRLTEEAVSRALADWLREARQTAKVSLVPTGLPAVPSPIPPP